jgi:hypothetical protein
VSAAVVCRHLFLFFFLMPLISFPDVLRTFGRQVTISQRQEAAVAPGSDPLGLEQAMTLKNTVTVETWKAAHGMPRAVCMHIHMARRSVDAQ